MKFTSIKSLWTGDMLEVMHWDFVGCKTCHQNSMSGVMAHLDKCTVVKDTPAFQLCERCSKELDEIKKYHKDKEHE